MQFYAILHKALERPRILASADVIAPIPMDTVINSFPRKDDLTGQSEL